LYRTTLQFDFDQNQASTAEVDLAYRRWVAFRAGKRASPIDGLLCADHNSSHAFSEPERLLKIASAFLAVVVSPLVIRQLGEHTHQERH